MGSNVQLQPTRWAFRPSTNVVSANVLSRRYHGMSPVQRQKVLDNLADEAESALAARSQLVAVAETVAVVVLHVLVTSYSLAVTDGAAIITACSKLRQQTSASTTAAIKKARTAKRTRASGGQRDRSKRNSNTSSTSSNASSSSRFASSSSSSSSWPAGVGQLQYCVLDEAHKICNPRTQQSQACKFIGRCGACVILFYLGRALVSCVDAS